MIIFKAAGLLIAFFVPTVYGFLKAYNISKRNEKLKQFSVSLNELSEYIRLENSEKGELFKRCFGEEHLDKNLKINTEFLKKEDITLINEFLEGFGLKDKISEYDRTKLYITRLNVNCENAKEEKDKLCKLYSSLGVLSGLALCIFLI